MFKSAKSTLTVLGSMTFLALVAFQATSQDAPPDRGGRGRGQFDPAAMQQRRLDGIKEGLGASEEEWKVLSPKIEVLLKLQTETLLGGGFGGRGGPGGGRGGRGGDATADDPNASASTKARRELRRVLEDKATSTDEITRKLDSYRKARDEAKAVLAKAQNDLRELLTKRQEAQLVVDRMLD